MADDDKKTGRHIQMYDRPADADKPPVNRMMPIFIVVAVLVAALLLAKFVFHVHFGQMLHAGH